MSSQILKVSTFPKRVRKYALGAATDSGSDPPARAISGSSWRRYDWRLYATARTDDHLSRAAGHHRTGSRRTVRPRDCSCTRLLSLDRSEEHTSELQSHSDIVCRLLLDKKNECQLKLRHA